MAQIDLTWAARAKILMIGKFESINFWEKRGWRRYIGPKRLILLGIFGGGLAALHYLRLHGYLTPELVFRFIQVHPVSAPLLFIAFYFLATLFLVPSLPLNLGAGILWGPFWGSILATLGFLSGAIPAFLIARTALGQPLAKRFNNRFLLWLQNELDTRGWRVVAFIRLNPIFPSGPLNFVFGLSSISFATYLWATLVFIYPPALAFAIIGYASGQFLVQGLSGDLWKAVMLISLAVTALFLIGPLVSRWYRKNHQPAGGSAAIQRMGVYESKPVGNDPE
jgi:uncharacterized membrane protein YdjX (TVP38/TMEM64 family)